MIKNFSKHMLHKLVLSRTCRTQFWILLAFLVTFLISRNIASFDPSRVFHYDGHHIHHYTYGIIILAFAGFVSLTSSKRARNWVAVVYGIGLGMVFDEFALWMIPSSSYWSDGSYDAVTVVLIVLLIGVYFENFLIRLAHRLQSVTGFMRGSTKVQMRSAFGLKGGARPFISVVIPAFNESESVAKAVRAIRAQKLDLDFEVIVADNDSSDDTVQQARVAGADRVVIESNTQGANAARQAGLSAASGDIVAFIDADCQPPPDWLSKVVEQLTTRDIIAISGPYDHGFRGLKRQVEKVYVSKVMPHVPGVLSFFFRKPAGVLIGGNFAAWRGAFDAVGGITQPKFWGDDAVIAMRLSKVGKVEFNPKLEMPASSRRYEEKGFVRLPIIYIINYLRAYYTA